MNAHDWSKKTRNREISTKSAEDMKRDEQANISVSGQQPNSVPHVKGTYRKGDIS